MEIFVASYGHRIDKYSDPICASKENVREVIEEKYI